MNCVQEIQTTRNESHYDEPPWPGSFTSYFSPSLTLTRTIHSQLPCRFPVSHLSIDLCLRASHVATMRSHSGLIAGKMFVVLSCCSITPGTERGEFPVGPVAGEKLMMVAHESGGDEEESEGLEERSSPRGTL